jgi:CubicO group peptidase (beta-lactamase class C family)
MKILSAFRPLLGLVLLCAAFLLHAQPNNGLAPEVTLLNTKDNLYALEFKLPDLEKPYISVAPEDKKDGIPVGKLGVDGGNRDLIEKYAEELASAPKDEKIGNTDSLLISYRGNLIFESYFRRGRANFPHYQMSITKSYTALALGRAMQLGLLKLEDVDKPAISFLKKLDPSKLAPGAEAITLAQAMQMSSGIRLSDEKAKELLKNPAQLKGLGEIQAYLQYSDPVPLAPRKFKYQESDPAIAMQVLNAVAPAGAEEFIKNELLKPMGITSYHWDTAVSGLPKSAAGCCLRSRDMMKFGMLILNKGKWQGQQLIPEAYIIKATSPNVHSYGTAYYGFFWWVEDLKVGERTYQCKEGRGAGGQFILMFPELDLIAVVTSHDKGMGNMLATLPQRIIPAFDAN